MNLLNRYLQAVARLLPRERRDDIIAELRANILAQMEDREQELGRLLTEDEIAEMLRHHGNPSLVAGRYRENNLGLAFGKQLIGPELFPFYKTSLLINLSLTLVIFICLIPIAHMAGSTIVLSRALIPLAVQFAAVTLIMILIDRNKGRVLDNWDPRKLPAMKAEAGDGPNAASIFSFLATAIGTLWLALSPRWPYLLLGPGAAVVQALPMKMMPQWMDFYWAIVALLSAQLVLQFFTLFRWMPCTQARMVNLALKLVGLTIGVLLLLKAPNYVTSPNQKVADWANLNFLICLIVALMINLWGTGRLALSLMRDRNHVLTARSV